MPRRDTLSAGSRDVVGEESAGRLARRFGLRSLIGAMVGVLCLALAVTQASAQDLSRYAPDGGGQADALYLRANTLPAIRECLEAQSQPEGDWTACPGLTMGVCLEFPVNETTTGSIRCASGETEAWEAIAEETLARIDAKADDGLKAALAASQESWIAHRDAACRLWHEVFRGGSLARQIGADCVREITARRAIDLMGVAESIDPRGDQ